MPTASLALSVPGTRFVPGTVLKGHHCCSVTFLPARKASRPLELAPGRVQVPGIPGALMNTE